MIVEFPDVRGGEKLSREEMRLETACGLYSRGRLGRIAAAELAGVDLIVFTQALKERGIAVYTEEMLDEDLKSLQALFPK
jgi:predicted HTH domain antitoxin